MSDLESFLKRAHTLLDRLEGLLPEAAPAASPDSGSSFRWRRRGQRAGLEEVRSAWQFACDGTGRQRLQGA